MNTISKTFLIWVGLAVALFAAFHWLFSLALPDAALAFSVGATVIVMGGFVTGWYGSRVWFTVTNFPSNNVLAGLVAVVLGGFIVIAFMLNRMIGETQLFDFAITVLMIFLVCTSFSAMISLMRLRTKNKLQRAHTEAAHSKSELLLLQSQLSPHFLFNTLNNIYGLSLSDHTRVPPLLLKLSDLLRYSVYEAKELFVPVREEVEYLKNYIEFEKIRLGDRLNLRCEFSVSDQHEKIAPMLLIVFVENAFKHSRNINEKAVLIELTLRQEGKELKFSISNPVSTPNVRSALEQRHSGFGLDNVKRRLALLYPERHRLDIKEAENRFRVNLILNH